MLFDVSPIDDPDRIVPALAEIPPLLEIKFDRLRNTCFTADVRGGLQVNLVQKAWDAFSPTEQRLLELGRVISWIKLLALFRSLMPQASQAGFKRCTSMIIRRLGYVRLCLRTGSMQAPSDERSQTEYVRA